METAGNIETPNDRVRQVQIESGLNQTQFASVLGIGSQAYTDIVKGRNNPTVKHLTILIEKLKVNPTWILTGRGQRYLHPDLPAFNEPGISYGLEPPKEHDTLIYNARTVKGQVNTFDVLHNSEPIGSIKLPGLAPSDYILIVRGESVIQNATPPKRKRPLSNDNRRSRDSKVDPEEITSFIFACDSLLSEVEF